MANGYTSVQSLSSDTIRPETMLEMLIYLYMCLVFALLKLL